MYVCIIYVCMYVCTYVGTYYISMYVAKTVKFLPWFVIKFLCLSNDSSRTNFPKYGLWSNLERSLCCDGVVGRVTRYMPDGPRIQSWWGKIFCIHSEWPWGPPSLLYSGYQLSFPGLMWPGHGIDHPPSSSVDVKERVELYLYSVSGSSWPLLGWTLPLSLPYFCQRLFDQSHTSYLLKTEAPNTVQVPICTS